MKLITCLICNNIKEIFTKNKCKKCYNKEYRKTYYIKNREKLDAKHKLWSENNKRHEMTSARKAYKSLKNKSEYSKNYKKQWRKDNKKLLRLYRAKRRGVIRKSTPIWVDMKKLIEFYENCKDNMTVDHIIPLCGKDVSGLNVPWNLHMIISLGEKILSTIIR